MTTLAGGASAYAGASFASTNGLTPLVLAAVLVASLGIANFVWLSPLSRAAAQIRSDDSPRQSAASVGERRDDVAVILTRLATYAAEEKSLEHRRSQVHAISGLPTREPLLAAIAADIECGVEHGTVAAIRWADYDRVAGFDGEAAAGFLAAFARRLRTLVAKGRPLAQIGHDCFAVWFSGSSPASVASELRAIAYALTADLETPIGVLVPEIVLGAASFPQDENTPDALLLRAKVARASFDEAGGEIVLRTDFAAIELSNDFALEQQLRHAIERRELALHYQPVIDANAGSLIGAEALLRWTLAAIADRSRRCALSR